MGWLGRVIPGNGATVPALVFGPDAWGLHAASLGVFTATQSPSSAGGPLHGYGGDVGYGVNRWAGSGLEASTVQPFHTVVTPILSPESQRLGAGAGVAGQPGLPSTGYLADADGFAFGGYGMVG